VRRLARIVLLLALLAPGLALAVTPGEMLKDPAAEARARTLSRELRCMVCQNQSIDDSDAPLAHDIRVLVRQRIEAGDTDKQVIDYLVARYGEFVLLRPRFEAHTLILWGAAPAMLIGGAVVLFLIARRRRRSGQANAQNDDESKNLTPEEQKKLATLVVPPAD
jgi:cytochrome c-type biogenesis protein CcmH